MVCIHYNPQHSSSIKDSILLLAVLQLWIITILLIRLQQPAAATHTVQRLNYGVLFTKKAQLGAAEQHWRHTFKLTTQTQTTPHHLPEVMCNISNPVLCNQLTANMGMLNKLHLYANSIVDQQNHQHSSAVYKHLSLQQPFNTVGWDVDPFCNL